MPNFYYKTVSGGLNDVIGQFSRFALLNHFLLQSTSFLYHINSARFSFGADDFDSDVLFRKPDIREEDFTRVISFDEWFCIVTEKTLDEIDFYGQVLVDCTRGRTNLYNPTLQQKIKDGLGKGISISDSRALAKNILAAQFRTGSILREYQFTENGHIDLDALREEDSFRVVLNLRRGDLAVLFKEDFEGTHLHDLFEDEVLCGIATPGPDGNNSHFISKHWFNEMLEQRSGLIGERYQNQLPLSAYLKYLQSDTFNSIAQNRHTHITICSDGYSHTARLLARNRRDIDINGLEFEITRKMLGELLIKSNTKIIGESSDCFLETIKKTLKAHHVVNLESYFPITFTSLFKPPSCFAPRASFIESLV
jgi:hypothetical protein